MATKQQAPKPAVTENLESSKPEGEDGALQPTPELNPRNAALMNIAKRSEDPTVRAEIIGEDPAGAVPIVERADGEEPPVPNVAGDSAPAAEGEEQQPLAEGAAEGEEQQSQPEMVKIIVDGQEQLVPKDKVVERGIAALQKETAVDSRLAAVDELLSQLRRAAAPAAPQPAQPAQPTPKPLEERVAELHQAIAYGTPEQGQAAMLEFLQLSANVAENVKGEVLTVVDQRAAAKEFASKYDDLIKDPMAMELVFSLERRVRAEEQAKGLRPTPFGELYSAIGEQVRSYRTKLRETGSAAPNGGSEQPTPTAPTGGAQPAPQNQRTAAKLNAPRAVSGSGAPPVKQASTKVPTASDVISQMAQLRGQRQGLTRQN